jgi:hypothetical protein
MSRINRVEVQEFAFELPDLGFDAGGILFASPLQLTKM